MSLSIDTGFKETYEDDAYGFLLTVIISTLKLVPIIEEIGYVELAKCYQHVSIQKFKQLEEAIKRKEEIGYLTLSILEGYFQEAMDEYKAFIGPLREGVSKEITEEARAQINEVLVECRNEYIGIINGFYDNRVINYNQYATQADSGITEDMNSWQ